MKLIENENMLPFSGQPAPVENVMLISMSTLPRYPKFNTYQIQEGGETLYFKSLSQMEPHTKYVLWKLTAKGKKLDRIVILESEKARTEIPDHWGGETATTLFRKRIASYLGYPGKTEIQCEDELAGNSESLPKKNDGKSDAPGMEMPAIVTINNEEPVYFWKAVWAILGCEPENRDPGKRIHLYMDMQGGERNAVSQMNAIVELLKRQGVTVMGRYANDFEPKRPTPLHTIREASQEYRTYDLISAMDVFTSYGWGDSLEKYFHGRVRGSSKERKLIKAIQQASSAISKCNADGFDGAVRKIEALQADFKNPDHITELDVVFQDIRNDYMTLFHTKHRYVSQIRWCLDKKFLQQALTIFEAKMPQEFVMSGLLYYLTKDSSEEEQQQFLETCRDMYLREFTYTDGYGRLRYKAGRFRMKDINHYLIKEYCNGFDRRTRTNYIHDPHHILHLGLGEEHRDEVSALLTEYRDLCGLRNQMNHAITGKHPQEGFYAYMKESFSNDSNWRDSTGANYEKQIRDYLDRWEALADQVPEELSTNILDKS